MTPDDLEALILEAENGWHLQKAFAPLDEKERAKLSTTAQKLYRQLYQSKANDSASDRLKKFIDARNKKVERWNTWNSTQTRNAIHALFALCPLSTVKRRDIFWHSDKDVFERILVDRRPDWLDEWIAHDLDAEFTHIEFPMLRRWVRNGVCSKPSVDGYYRMLAWYLQRPRDGDRHAPPLTKQLLEDPALFEDIEGLFRVENIAFNTNGWLTAGASENYESWTDALIKLSSEGHLDRLQILEHALGGLTLDLKQNQLSGFHSFYRRMTPTGDERLRHQQNYISLLCHPVGHVVKFAIDMLSDIEKQGALDTETVLSETQTVFLSEGKGNAVSALKLINRIIGRQKKGAESALDAACEALRHVHADVQAQALDILEKNKDRLSNGQIETLADFESFVAASNRKRLAALASCDSSKGGKAPSASVRQSATKADGSQASVVEYRPLSDDVNACRVLSPESAVAPIETIDELIDAVLHAVEVVDAPDDVERIFDGISRLANDRPADFDARVAPLRHRIEKGRTGANSILIGQTGFGLPMLDLLYTWMTGSLYHTPKGKDQHSQYYEDVDAFVPMAAHFRAIAERVAKRKGQALLSAPTHKGGWIDPLVWIERLSKFRATDDSLNDVDLILSLLRLAPDGRSDALSSIASVPAPLRRTASFALGGEEAPSRADRKHYAAWISAARCRAPHKDWSTEFAALNIDDKWPGGILPARYEWRTSHKKGQHERQTWRTPEFDVNVTCEGNAPTVDRSEGFLSRVQHAISGRIVTEWQRLPTAAANRRMDKNHYWSGELRTTWVAQWLAYIWPQNPAAAMIRGATKLMQRMDEDSSNWTPGHGYLHSLFQKNRPWGESGHLLLCIGMAGKDADAKGLATDALVEGIEGTLFDPDLFAATMTRVAHGEWVKYGRLADGLMLAVQVSELHAHVIGDALHKWLPSMDFAQKNSFRVLEVLVEAQAVTKAPLRDDTLAALRKIDGSGKATKLAKVLLKI
jgi:hypothetical protein